MTIDYKSRPQNQFGQIKKHRITRQSRYDENGNILCTYCITYKPKKDFLLTNLKRHFYRCYVCDYQHRKERVGNINRLIDNIYGHQKEKLGKQPCYTVEQFSAWLATTNFFELHRTWIVFNLEKDYVPAVLRINPKKPYALDNLRVTTARLARLTCSHMRDRKIIQLDLDGNELAQFNNARVAAQFLGYKYYSNIHEVCKGTKGTAAGFKWRYA